MTLEKALNAFYRSEFGEHKRIEKYVKTSDGFILFPNDGIIPILGGFYYLVTDSGDVRPIHPLLCNYDENQVKSVSK